MAITTTADLLSAATTAYEQLAYMPLRRLLYFDRCADIQPTNQSHRGNVVTFNIYDDLPVDVTPLSETVDVTPATITDNNVTVTLQEYGNAASTTAAARGLSYLPISRNVANIVGYNGGKVFDSLARNPLVAGTQVAYAGDATSRITIDAADLLTGSDVRAITALLADASVQPVMNNFYKAFISPLVSMDLREDTGPGNWRDPHVYSQPAEIWNGEVGAFERAAFIETPRVSAPELETNQGGPGGFVDGGAGGTVDVYPTLFLGQQALAKTWAELVSPPIPEIVLGAVVDTLRRFVPVGWYWLGGFGRFREEALWRVESAASLGANT